MICEPLELEYVAAGLPEHDVQIIDMILEDDLEQRLRLFQPDIVGTSSYITGVNEAIKVCRAAKRHVPGCLTVTGGVHAAVAPEDYADPAVDCVALGDGTSLMPSLVSVARRERALLDIPGLAIPSGPGRVVHTARAAYMPNPDELPFPRRDLVSHLRNKYYYLFHQPVATMKTTWGCWYTCKFCMTWNVTAGETFSRSPRSIVDELEMIREQEVYIVDDIFLFNAKRLTETARLLRERGIKKKYLVYGRADFIAANAETIREWADLGLSAVIVGLEAGTNQELTEYEKSCTVEENRRAVRVLQEHGVDVYASFIPGPDYGAREWEQLFRFIDDNNLYYVNISPLTPLPGSPMWPTFEKHVTVDRRAHGLWDLTHCVLPTRTPLKSYYRNLLRVYARTVLNIRRANRLTLRTRPPVWSPKYLRLWLGAWKIFRQFKTAHRHHAPSELATAMDRGRDGCGASYRYQSEIESEDNFAQRAPEPGRTSDGTNEDNETGHELKPEDPFRGFFSRHPRPPVDGDGSLLDIPAAREWYRVVSWGVRTGLYTYQQPFIAQEGPFCELHGRRYRMLSAYDYLGLIGHPKLEEAAEDAIRKYGTGTGGVRLLTGSTDLHAELDEAIAHFKGVEACLTFSSGYLANIASISALFHRGDRVLLDERIHRSVRDACRLSRANVRSFRHNDCNHLESLLQDNCSSKKTLVVVEGVYSMDGDVCPLPQILTLKERYGAYLMVDEAHSFGVMGRSGRGIDEHFGLEPDSVDIWMGTMSKAIPSTGGFIAGRRALITYLQHGAAPYMFSAAATPSSVAAALASLQVIASEPWRIDRVAQNARFMLEQLGDMGFRTGTSCSHVVPIIIGADADAYRFSRRLFGRGIIALAVVSPAVKLGSARLRLCATAAQDQEFLCETLAEFLPAIKEIQDRRTLTR